MAVLREQSRASTGSLVAIHAPLCDHQTNEIEHVRTMAEARIISNSFPKKHEKGVEGLSLSPFVGETT